MDPFTMLMMMGKLGGFATDAAASVVSAGASAIGTGAFATGKKIIQVSASAGKTVSKIGFTFIKGGITAVRDVGEERTINDKSNIKTEKLSKKMGIVDNGLSIPFSFSENQFKKINQEIKDDLKIIKGQNELLFLSNSIRYFVESHMGRTGIDRGISYALQYDMKAVTNHLRDNPGLRFPGYLLHQCTSLAETIKDMNLFYDAILHNGHVKEWTFDTAKAEIEMMFGTEDDRKKFIQGYIPFELQIPVKRDIITQIQKNKSWKDVFSGDEQEINDEAHDTLFIVANELIANENLEYEISKMLEIVPEKKLFIEAP